MELEIDDGLEVTQQGTQQSAAQPDATQETDDIVHFGRVRNRYHFHISASPPQNLLQFSLIFPSFPTLLFHIHSILISRLSATTEHAIRWMLTISSIRSLVRWNSSS